MLQNDQNFLSVISSKLNSIVDMYKPYAATFLRVGVSLVVLWFGYQQIVDSQNWIGYLPDWTGMLPISPTNLIYLNGTFELVFGTMMLVGLFTRFSALLVALHMLEITYVVGFNATGVRDFGIFIGLFSVFLNGVSPVSLDRAFSSNNTSGDIKSTM